MPTFIGHLKQWEYLQKLAQSKRMPQALIFSGPSEIGKFLVARAWAEELIRNNSDCLVIEPELVTKKGVTRAKDIGVGAVRDTVKQAALSSGGGKYRVLIIRDAHRLTEKSQNALLKTLEEPPEHLIIILVTHRVGRLLSTVLSRCQKVDFHLVDEALMRSGMPSKKAVLEWIWQIGRPGLVRRCIDTPVKMKRDLELFERLSKLPSYSVQQKLQLSESMAKDITKTICLLEWWLTLLHSRAAQGNDRAAWKLAERVFAVEQVLENQSKSSRLVLDTLFLGV
ncbi:MAG: AAA family ATPase [Candidatus Moraniibacteriota bacterium]